jgi:uncharacterized protein YqgV (UPF0045/DUF77 family)
LWKLEKQSETRRDSKSTILNHMQPGGSSYSFRAQGPSVSVVQLSTEAELKAFAEAFGTTAKFGLRAKTPKLNTTVEISINDLLNYIPASDSIDSGIRLSFDGLATLKVRVTFKAWVYNSLPNCPHKPLYSFLSYEYTPEENNHGMFKVGNNFQDKDDNYFCLIEVTPNKVVAEVEETATDSDMNYEVGQRVEYCGAARLQELAELLGAL